MKNLKKILVGSGAVVLGVTLLGGCSASNNNTPSNNNSSSEKKEDTSKKQETKKDENGGIDTTGLKDKKVGDATFKTSMLDKWDDKDTEGLDSTMLIDETNGNNITVSISAGSSTYGITSWDDKSAESIKSSLESAGFKDITVGHTKVNGKEAFKVAYKFASTTIELYYIQLSDSKMAVVTYTVIKADASFEKELNNIVNTINVA